MAEINPATIPAHDAGIVSYSILRSLNCRRCWTIAITSYTTPIIIKIIEKCLGPMICADANSFPMRRSS